MVLRVVCRDMAPKRDWQSKRDAHKPVSHSSSPLERLTVIPTGASAQTAEAPVRSADKAVGQNRNPVRVETVSSEILTAKSTGVASPDPPGFGGRGETVGSPTPTFPETLTAKSIHEDLTLFLPPFP